MNIQSDLAIAAVTGKNIDDYVNSEVLFYPLGAGATTAISEFTIGAWLECAWRLGAAPLEPAQKAALAAVHATVDDARGRAKPLYEQKTRREFKSRIDSLNWYLDSGQGGPGGYVTQAHTRLKLHLLKLDVTQSEPELRRLEGLDNRLRSRFATGAFVFEPKLASVAPMDSMWWLYGSISPTPGS